MKFLGKDVCEVMDLKDKVVEFEITSNRPDCFSTVGLAEKLRLLIIKNLSILK